MKHYTFKRESNKFDDILKDPSLKKFIKTKISWQTYLTIGLSSTTSDDILGYIILKYGEDLVNDLVHDYSPKPNIDYLPIRF